MKARSQLASLSVWGKPQNKSRVSWTTEVWLVLRT
jgi:hypothetical protein